MMKNVKLVFLEYLEDHAGTVLVNVSEIKDISITNCEYCKAFLLRMIIKYIFGKY